MVSFGLLAAAFGRWCHHHDRADGAQSGNRPMDKHGVRVVTTHRALLASAALLPKTLLFHLPRMGRMKFRGYRRLICVAAHLALLLAVCAPVVSRLLMPDSMVMNAHAMAVSGDLSTTHGAAMDTQGTAQHPDGKLPTDACAYCSLFAQLPYALAVAATLATLPALPVPLFPATQVQIGVQPPLPAFRPRGPPADLVLA